MRVVGEDAFERHFRAGADVRVTQSCQTRSVIAYCVGKLRQCETGRESVHQGVTLRGVGRCVSKCISAVEAIKRDLLIGEGKCGGGSSSGSGSSSDGGSGGGSGGVCVYQITELSSLVTWTEEGAATETDVAPAHAAGENPISASVDEYGSAAAGGAVKGFTSRVVVHLTTIPKLLPRAHGGYQSTKPATVVGTPAPAPSLSRAAAPAGAYVSAGVRTREACKRRGRRKKRSATSIQRVQLL
jgi:hypothetical protein